MAKPMALSHYGILNGMAFPFIFFPTALTGSLSVLLLPAVSKASKEKNSGYLYKVICFSLLFSGGLGCACTVFFILAGNFLGNFVFHEPQAGNYICILAWLCPFMYLSSTLGSILNGLGKVYQTFGISVISLCIKIGCLMLLVPEYGMPAYFFTLLSSQAFSTMAESLILFKVTKTSGMTK
jgi:stage V sporulation protein B